MALGSVKESNKTYLTVAGGRIWNRKADESDPNYASQDYTTIDGDVKQRTGAMYADLTSTIELVEFRTHDQYGDSINITFTDDYILSIGMNNPNAQGIMKALHLIDLTKPLYLRPYEFEDKVTKKRVRGIYFEQDGEKVNLRDFKVTDKKLQKDESFYKTATKKQIKRFFEDLDDYLRAEVEANVIPKLLNPVKKGLGTIDEDIDLEAQLNDLV